MIFFRELNTKALKVFFIYTILQAIFVLLCAISIYYYKSYSTYIFFLRIHVIVEYLILSYFIYNILRSKIIKKLLLSLALPYLIFNVFDYYKYGNATFGNFPNLIEFFILIIFIIYFLFEKMQFSFERPIYQTINFWICVGLFVYFSGSFFYILLAVNSISNEDIKNDAIGIFSFVTIIKNIILSIAFFQNENNNTDNSVLKIPNELNLDSFINKNALN